ncbi:MAG: NCS2 family permease [Deltaproteobacteria bacterium]|jgi:AGZA family xanthine/uracil permease-like MFS transporter|nr:NCS2 family permease [Deltaproteobacteria bacterium]
MNVNPSSSRIGKPQPWFVSSDIDGFFGLAIDNLIQFLLILSLCTAVLGFSLDLLLGTILPGAAVSVLLGNLFYAWQAQKLSARTGRTDVTALPYGINTVSLFAYVFLVMLPVKLEATARGMAPEEAAKVAWQIGLAACFVSAAIEFVGSFVADRIRKVTPRAALLSTLAGIAISFIAIDFAIRTFAMPLVALLPLGVILTTYFSHEKMPLRIPGGAWAILLGTGAAWILYALGQDGTPVSPDHLGPATATVGLHVPAPVVGDLIAGLRHPLGHQFLIPVMLPMGLFNVLGSLQNIESAEAAGDGYPTLPSLAANGIGSMVAAAFGSCFPTTIYIGHPGWKGLGARSGYSTLNGIFFTVVALFGLTNIIHAIVPIEAGMAIVLWIGIVITAQAFQATSRAHASAVAFGLFPAIAAWGVLIVTQTLGGAGAALGQMDLAARALAQPGAFARGGLDLEGLVALSQGFILVCMIWAAISAYLLDRKFTRAAQWAGVGALCAFFGFMHAGRITPAGSVYDIGWGVGWKWSLGYLMCGAFFVLMQLWSNHQSHAADEAAKPS